MRRSIIATLGLLWLATGGAGAESDVDPAAVERFTDGDAAHGAALYKRYCRGCHGEDGPGGAYRGNPIDRPYPNLYIGEEPYVPTKWPYKFQHHVDGNARRAAHRRQSNPDGYINPILEWDTNSPIDGITLERLGLRQGQPPVRRGLRHPRHRAGEPGADLEPSGVKWSYLARNIEMGPNAYQKPENRGGLERPNDVVFSNDGRTMYIVDYGEVYTDFEMPSPFYTVAKSGVIWTVTRTGG